MITDHPFLTAYALCALIALAGAVVAAAAATRRTAPERPPIRRAARKTAHAVRGIPAPRAAPDNRPTHPTGDASPADRYAHHHAEEISAVLGCTCSASLRGETAMDQNEHAGPTVHDTTVDESTTRQITTEYAITYPGAVGVALLFDGPTAETDAYALAELLGTTSYTDWAMRTRTVETTITRAPWIDVASAAELFGDSPEDLAHGIGPDGQCVACAAQVVRLTENDPRTGL